MLPNSFVFLPRIGEKLERRLWTRGIRSWNAYRDHGERVRGVNARLKRQHDDVLEVAERALGKDPKFFANLLPQSEHWRAFGEYGAHAAFVDIETTGGWKGRNDVTVVGVKVGERATRLFVRTEERPILDRDTIAPGCVVEDLTPANVARELAHASLFVTFNGSTFDIPEIRKFGVDVPAIPHLDLRHALTRLGFKGGLKKVEKQLGVDRGDELEGVSGFEAVILWHKHETGDEKALPKLLKYNRADVEGMIPLAEYAYTHLRERTFEDACRAGDALKLARRERPLTEGP